MEEKKSLKSTIENHPVIVFGTAMTIGFAAYPALLELLDRTTISKTELQTLQVGGRTSTNTTRYEYAEGFFAKTNEGWIEQRNSQPLPSVTWKESNVDKDYIYLADPSRKMILRLPIRGGIATWASEGNPNTWNNLATVQPR